MNNKVLIAVIILVLLGAVFFVTKKQNKYQAPTQYTQDQSSLSDDELIDQELQKIEQNLNEGNENDFNPGVLTE